MNFSFIFENRKELRGLVILFILGLTWGYFGQRFYMSNGEINIPIFILASFIIGLLRIPIERFLDSWTICKLTSE